MQIIDGLPDWRLFDAPALWAAYQTRRANEMAKVTETTKITHTAVRRLGRLDGLMSTIIE